MKKLACSPETCIVTFDIHGVLFRLDYPKIIKLVCKSPQKWHLIQAFFSIKSWRTVISNLETYISVEHFFNEIAKDDHKLASCIPLFISIAAAQKPIDEMINTVKELKRKGYTIHILSNFGPRMLKKLEEQYPDIFALFDAVQITCTESNYLAKPNHPMFQEYLKRQNKENKAVIFIDDNRENLNAAAENGFITIQYFTPKEVRSSMHQLGIL